MPVILSARIPLCTFFHQSKKRKRGFLATIIETPDILGLKQPCLKNLHPLGDQWLIRHTPESWKFVVTAVMETMRRSESSGFGLVP